MAKSILFRPNRIIAQEVVLNGQREVQPGGKIANHGQVHQIFEQTLLDDCDCPYVDSRQKDEGNQP
jgi:hypothetical protein